MLYGWLLDNNSHRGESLADLPYPVVLLQRCKGRGDRFIECLRGDFYGVLNVSKISDRNCARSKNHVQERNTFVFCSPARAVAIPQAGSRAVISRKPVAQSQAGADSGVPSVAIPKTIEVLVIQTPK